MGLEEQLGVDVDDRMELSPERVEHYMRAHRRDFENTRQQRLPCEVDRDAGLPGKQIKDRLDSRFLSNY